MNMKISQDSKKLFSICVRGCQSISFEGNSLMYALKFEVKYWN